MMILGPIAEQLNQSCMTLGQELVVVYVILLPENTLFRLTGAVHHLWMLGRHIDCENT